MAKYSKKSQDTVEDTMHEFKEGKLLSGSGQKVTSRKQAIAIGLSEAREKGAKVPAPKKSRKSAAKKKSTGAKKTGTKRKATSGKSTARKSTARKSTAKKSSSGK